MIRTWLSSFIKNNKTKILNVFKGLGIIILISTSVGILFSQMLKNETEMTDNNKIYIPNETVISGGNIKQEEFAEQDNLVKTFVNYCNEQNFKEAYNLLSSDCKQKEFPTFQKFKTDYCDLIFSTQKNYNIQSWVNDDNYSTYRVKFTEDFISTGNYNSAQKYEDYITIVTDKENNDRKLNVNGYIRTKQLDEITKTNLIEAKALYVDIYMEYIVYYLDIKNITNNDILLDNLKNATTKMIGTNEATYKLNDLNLSVIDLIIDANSKKQIKLIFNKQYGSNINGDRIEFKKTITNYVKYRQDMDNYNNYENITIKL